MFKAALTAKSNGKELDADSSAIKKGFAVLGKYEKKCSKK